MTKKEKEKQVEIQSDSIDLIKELLSPEIVKKKKFVWQEIVAAMMDITKTYTREAEELLVGVPEQYLGNHFNGFGLIP